MKDVWDVIAARAAVIASLLFAGGVVGGAMLTSDNVLVFDDARMGYMTIGPHSWLFGVFPAVGVCFYAVAQACAARTPNPMRNSTPLVAITLSAFLIVIVGSTVLYSTGQSSPSALAMLVSIACFVGVVGLFALVWSTIAALKHAETPSCPPRLAEVLPTFIAVTLALPIGLWFMQSQVIAVLARPRLSRKAAP